MKQFEQQQQNAYLQLRKYFCDPTTVLVIFRTRLDMHGILEGKFTNATRGKHILYCTQIQASFPRSTIL